MSTASGPTTSRSTPGTLLPGESTLVVFDDEGRYDLVDVTDDDHTMTVVASSGRPAD